MTTLVIGEMKGGKRTFMMFDKKRIETFDATLPQLEQMKGTLDIMINDLQERGITWHT
jgi:hypothetical protein